MASPEEFPAQQDSGGFQIVRGQLPGNLRLLSDLHLDAAITDQRLILHELEQALYHNERICINGDVFDLILPQDKKRFVPSVLHPDLRGCDDLINRIVDMGFELLKPYAHLIDFIGIGNHCGSTPVKYHAVDPVRLLVDQLNVYLLDTDRTPKISYGGYCGFMIYEVVGCKRPLVMYYHHGWGGGGKLTDATKDYYALSYVEGADIYWLGHRHARMNASVNRILPPKGRNNQPEIREVRYIRTGSYQRPAKALRKSGRKGNYLMDGGYALNGQGGARVLISNRSAKDFNLTVEQ